MIGNDVIDLKLASRQSNWRRRGFLEKVFTTSEKQILSASEEKDVGIWLLWSMKEAAYKAHQRKRLLPRRVNWKIQECLSLKYNETSATGVIKIEEDEYFSFSSLNSDLIHTIAINPETLIYMESLGALSLHQTKQVFKQEVSKEMELPIISLELKKNTEGIPLLYYENQPLPLAFSFSDHGRFSGFCVTLMDS